jgi:hypothetical protein
MKFYINTFLTLFIAASNSLHGQSFNVVENDTMYISNLPLETYTSHYIHVHNSGAEEIQMAWEKVSVSVSQDWEYSLCDLGTCYIGVPNGAVVAQNLLADSLGFFGMNFTPHSAGNGEVRVKIWDTALPQSPTYLTWIFSTDIAGLQTEALPYIKIYPNPANAFLNIDLPNNGDLFSISIISLTGQLIYEIKKRPAGLIVCETSEIASGIYLLRIDSGQYLTTSQIICVEKK